MIRSFYFSIYLKPKVFSIPPGGFSRLCLILSVIDNKLPLTEMEGSYYSRAYFFQSFTFRFSIGFLVGTNPESVRKMSRVIFANPIWVKKEFCYFFTLTTRILVRQFTNEVQNRWNMTLLSVTINQVQQNVGTRLFLSDL